jgi:4a-hydroxytetrahydrobiopterin dehydratase
MADLLSDDEVDEQLPDGWERDGDEIVRSFEFDEYMHGLAFAQTVAEIAEAQVHHPTMTIGYETVEVRFTTHEEGGITDADVEMAAFVDGEYGG